MRWPRDGRPCAPGEISARLEQHIDTSVRQRVLVAWVLSGWKWKPDPRRFGRRPRPQWRGVDVDTQT